MNNNNFKLVQRNTDDKTGCRQYLDIDAVTA